MNYTIEEVAKALKAARENKGLSQRELSARAGVPQSHISKIEQGQIDIRISSLVALTRSLDLELAFIPRHIVPAVSALAGNNKKENKYPFQVNREIRKIRDNIHALKLSDRSSNAATTLDRLINEIRQFKLDLSGVEQLKKANKAIIAYLKDINNIEALNQGMSQITSLRNTLVHSPDGNHASISRRPVYTLEEDDV